MLRDKRNTARFVTLFILFWFIKVRVTKYNALNTEELVYEESLGKYTQDRVLIEKLKTILRINRLEKYSVI